jgi:hypothetical protein
MPYNAAALGRGLPTYPGYGISTPYVSPAPSLAGGPSSMSGSPYIPPPVQNYSAPAYYPPYPTYQPPAGAALQGLASLTSAQGQYWNQIEQARITREQSRQMSMDTAKKQIELERWYEATKPTAASMAGVERKNDLTWARNYAQNTEIWSGRTLNILLRSILTSSFPTQGPNIGLDENTLRGLNLVDKSSTGNLALAKDDGKIAWPEALQEAAFDDVRDRFAKNFDTAIKTAREGEQPPIPVIRDLRNDFKTLESKLDEQVRDLSPNQYISSRRLLNQLKATLKGLSDPRICKSCNASWKKNVRTVSDLVGYCVRNGLEFGPAVAPEDYSSYSAAYYAIRNYEREAILTTSR